MNVVNALLNILGALALLASLYIGLALAGVLPAPYNLFGGWLYGVAPTVLTWMACSYFHAASRNSSDADDDAPVSDGDMVHN